MTAPADDAAADSDPPPDIPPGDEIELVAPADPTERVRKLRIDVDLSGSVDGQSFTATTGDDGTLRVDLPADVLAALPADNPQTTLALLRRTVVDTGQPIELSIDGQPSVSLTPHTGGDGTPRAKLKVLRWQSVVRTAWKRLFG